MDIKLISIIFSACMLALVGCSNDKPKPKKSGSGQQPFIPPTGQDPCATQNGSGQGNQQQQNNQQAGVGQQQQQAGNGPNFGLNDQNTVPQNNNPTQPNCNKTQNSSTSNTNNGDVKVDPFQTLLNPKEKAACDTANQIYNRPEKNCRIDTIIDAQHCNQTGIPQMFANGLDSSAAAAAKLAELMGQGFEIDQCGYYKRGDGTKDLERPLITLYLKKGGANNVLPSLDIKTIFKS